jgi:hypothetical protein
MDKLINAIMIGVILLTIMCGVSAINQLNDGRVLTVVQQLTSNQSAQAAK